MTKRQELLAQLEQFSGDAYPEDTSNAELVSELEALERIGVQVYWGCLEWLEETGIV